MCRGAFTLAVVLFSVLLSPAFAADRSEELTREAYAELVDRYRRGGYSAAAAALSQVPRETLHDAVRDYGKQVLTDRQRMAAAMLHTEAAFLDRRTESYHLKTVREYIEKIDHVSSRRDFEKRWYLAVSQRLRKLLHYENARSLLEVAHKAFPEDLEIRLAIAQAYETKGWQSDPLMLRRAEDEYRRILGVHPDHGETRLRLGRILQLKGQTEEALREIRWSLDHTDDTRLELVAYIVLGNIHNQRKELSEEIDALRAAVAIDPHCQVAAVALSHALHRAGDSAGSREVIEKLLAASGNASDHLDEWWRFHLMDSDDSMLEALREELGR